MGIRGGGGMNVRTLVVVTLVLGGVTTGRGVQDLTTDNVEELDDAPLLGMGMLLGGGPSVKEIITVPSNNSNYTAITKGLGPRIFGGTRGDMVFTVSAVNKELGETDEAPGKKSQKVTKGNKAKKSKKSKKNIPGKTLARAASDKANKSLFDLKPLYMGIQADRKRRRGIFGNCIASMNEMVLAKICKPGKMVKGECMEFTLPPMSVAMQTIYNNVRTNYCRYNTKACDSIMCYTYPGPVDKQSGLPTARSHTMENYPLWIEHNQTLRNNQTVATNTTMYAHYISFKIELEKVNFCEKINPPAETVDGSLKTLNCYSSRRCKMVELTRKGCVEGSSSMTPAPKVNCPGDSLFASKRRARENAITAMLCAQI